MALFRRELHDRFGAICEDEVRLESHTTMRIGGRAEHFLMPRDAAEAADLLALLSRRGVPVFVLGGGSNLLVRDEGFDGAVVNLSALRSVRVEGGRIRAGAGAPLAHVAKRAVWSDLSGLEGVVGIPGTIGGAVYMNAGGRYGSVGDVVESVLVADRAGHTLRLDRSRIEFGYRHTSLEGLIVLEVTVRLRRAPEGRVCQRVAAILKRKQRSQPWRERTAGCVFRNPGPERPAALLIDRAGLKGRSVGGAEVSSKHANFIVNARGAHAADVLALIAEVRREVLLQSGSALALEVHVLGPRGLETV